MGKRDSDDSYISVHINIDNLIDKVLKILGAIDRLFGSGILPRILSDRLGDDIRDDGSSDNESDSSDKEKVS